MIIKTAVYPLCSLKSRKLQDLWSHPFWLQTPSLLAILPRSYYPAFWMIHFFSFFFFYSFIAYAHISLPACFWSLYNFHMYSFVTCFFHSVLFLRFLHVDACHFPFLSSSLQVHHTSLRQVLLKLLSRVYSLNNATVNFLVQVTCCTFAQVSIDSIPRNRITGLKDTYIFNFSQ